MTAPARHAVRSVHRSERAALAAALADAFRDDQLSRWVYADHPARPRWVRADFRLRLAQHGPDRLTFTTDDLAGGAVWAAPRHWRGHAQGQLRALLALPRVVRNSARIFAIQQELDRRHPVQPHLYLALLGVTAPHRRRGLGSALLAPGLAVADARRHPAYVEAGSPEAAAFYARHDFREIGEVRVPGAPVVALMWREPR